MMDSRRSSCLIIEGEIGQGRATLISKLSNLALENGYFVLSTQKLSLSFISITPYPPSPTFTLTLTLINRLTSLLYPARFRVLYGEADSIDIAPFNVFKNVLLGMFRISASESADDRREKISSILLFLIFAFDVVLYLHFFIFVDYFKVANKIPVQFLPYLGLLNVILPMNFPASEKSLLLKGPARIDMLKRTSPPSYTFTFSSS